jgi:mercuric ion binding protein
MSNGIIYLILEKFIMPIHSRPSVVWCILFVSLLFAGLWSDPATAVESPADYTLQADGLACPFCAYGIEKQLMRISGVLSVDTEVASGTISITMKPGTTLIEPDARQAVEAAGFSMRNFRRIDET